MRNPTICHICDFGPEYGGTFIESLIFLNRYCRENLRVSTFCLFPDRAKNRRWLLELDKEEMGYGFVSYKRNIVGQVRSLLVDREPLVLHSHFFFFDLTALLLKYTVFKNTRVVWHYHSSPASTVQQRVKDAIKLGLIFGIFG